MIRVGVLGPLVIRVDGRRVTPRPIAGALLARLGLASGRTVALEQLVGDLWDGDGPAHPVNAVRVVASRARQVLGPDREALEATPGGYRLDASVDAAAFGALARAGADALAAGRNRDAAVALHRALALWRGPALAGTAAPFATGYAARLDAEHDAALERRIAADLACGRHREVLGELAALLAEHPEDEQLCGHWMVALYRAGRQADALAAYQAMRHRLVSTLGIEPGARLRRLEEAVLLQSTTLDGPGRPERLAVAPGRPARRRHGLVAMVTTLDRYRLVAVDGPAGAHPARAVSAPPRCS